MMCNIAAKWFGVNTAKRQSALGSTEKAYLARLTRKAYVKSTPDESPGRRLFGFFNNSYACSHWFIVIPEKA